jgi:DNA-binding transcriptional LysR family regulator
MHLEVEQLRALATLAEELSFTRAARRLGVAQPALSARISRMERRLGRQLVERSTRSVRITPAGLDLLDRARPMLAAAEAGTAEAQLSRGSSG